MKKHGYLIVSLLSLSACSFHKVMSEYPPLVAPPASFSVAVSESSEATYWYQSFDDAELDQLINKSFADNLGLAQAWSRLAQARSQADIDAADRFPSITTSASVTRQTSTVDGIPDTTTQQLTNTLSWELDLWGRISASVRAADMQVRASQQDLENTAMLLAGNITDVWFDIKQQHMLLKLVEAQIKTNEVFLELTELRRGLGTGSLLDVLQQQQQLARTKADIPGISSRLEQAYNQLATLVGENPGYLTNHTYSSLPDVPVFPKLPSPADLLQTRPDLKAAHARIVAADYSVASAVADRLPTFSLSLSSVFSAGSFGDLLDDSTSDLTGGLTAPLFDAGKRKSEVKRRKAVVDELLAVFSELYQLALLDVENALIAEKYQSATLGHTTRQVVLADAQLTESRISYRNGSTDYLPVLNALQSLQSLQQQEINEKRELLQQRTNLYLALGGGWTEHLQNQHSE